MPQAFKIYIVGKLVQWFQC